MIIQKEESKIALFLVVAGIFAFVYFGVIALWHY